MLNQDEVTRAVTLSQKIDEAFDGKVHEYMSILMDDFLSMAGESCLPLKVRDTSVFFLLQLSEIFREYDNVKLSCH